jgi:hypothetical protein
MRKFKVGDKVRWYTVDGSPLWNTAIIQKTPGGKGRWVEDRVSQIARSTFRAGGWWWPQPDDEYARYGEPGYLELVEAASEPRYRIVSLERPRRLEIFREGSWHTETSFPESCRTELEALCKKLNEQE